MRIQVTISWQSYGHHHLSSCMTAIAGDGMKVVLEVLELVDDQQSWWQHCQY
jgi:hypothetical protein